MPNALITGFTGQDGSYLAELLLEKGYEVLNVDALTYAGYLPSVRDVENRPNYRFLRANICDAEAMVGAVAQFGPDRVMHLAAESHVDRSITGAAEFIQTNVIGTFTLLETARNYWSNLPAARKAAFRFWPALAASARRQAPKVSPYFRILLI